MTEVYYLLYDMEKYKPYFDRKPYENREKSEVIEEFRKFYNEILPVDLTTWVRVNDPKDEMKWKDAFGDQIVFLRDNINQLFYKDWDESDKNPVLVINTHTSKSIKLPVYEINLRKYGIKMILRNNFHDWKVSIISDKEINIDFMNLFEEDKTIHPIYCEGFKENQVFGNYKDNKKQFTFEIRNDFNLYTFMYVLNHYLKNKRKGDKVT